jgi:hypothetical protein
MQELCASHARHLPPAEASAHRLLRQCASPAVRGAVLLHVPHACGCPRPLRRLHGLLDAGAPQPSPKARTGHVGVAAVTVGRVSVGLANRLLAVMHSLRFCSLGNRIEICFLAVFCTSVPAPSPCSLLFSGQLVSLPRLSCCCCVPCGFPFDGTDAVVDRPLVRRCRKQQNSIAKKMNLAHWPRFPISSRNQEMNHNNARTYSFYPMCTINTVPVRRNPELRML